MAVIEQHLQQNGPYQLGSRFSLIDIILGFWAEYLNSEQALGPCPAIRRCLGLVMDRPRLRPFFDELVECRNEYLQKQADDEGVK
jgi:glutathione S-transferase